MVWVNFSAFEQFICSNEKSIPCFWENDGSGFGAVIWSAYLQALGNTLANWKE